MSAIRDIIDNRSVSIFFASKKCRDVRRHEESEPNSMNRKFASLFVATGLWLGMAGTALAQVPNPPTDLSVEGGSSVPSQPTNPGRTLFFDDFEYDVSRSLTNATSQFRANGWSHVKAENSAESAGSGYLYT